MFCPRCSAEYRSGFERCADCQVPLVDVLPAPEDFPEEDLVTVFDSSDPILLSMAKSLLEGEGIPYVAQGEGALGVFPVPVVAKARIQVPESRAERASEILAELARSERPWGEELPDDEGDEPAS